MSFPLLRANLAVMSILRDEHVPALGRLEIRELRARWPRYALRGRDLDRSLDRLESLGLIEIDHVLGHHYVILTEMGYRSAHSIIGWLESLTAWPSRLRRRYQHLFDAQRGGEVRRRLMDRAEGPVRRGA